MLTHLLTYLLTHLLTYLPTRLRSEGISFDDDDCRGVVCVGVPLPNKAEPRIQAKARHNTCLASQQRAARGVRVLDGE